MWLQKTVLVVMMLIVAGSTRPSSPVAFSQVDPCVVVTTYGDVRGIDRGHSCEFRAVPFAIPPVGALRWQPPVAAAPWAPAILDATVTAPVCPQINPAGLPTGSEDCLKMNIWTPHPGHHAPLPVIVWLHPGSFVAASASIGAQNGTRFVEAADAIVVAPNYRLGAFGFLGHAALRNENTGYPSAGNYGLLDQRLALEWVRAHIAAFGGDPNRITIAGQSAGGLSVSLHLVSPNSDGLFHRAIMQGGFASYRWRGRAEGEAQADTFASALGCTNPTEVLTCLRLKTRNEVLLALPTGTEQFGETGRAQWGPLVDGLEIPDQPRMLYESGAFSRVPVLIGNNRDEGWTWVHRTYPNEISEAEYESALQVEFGVDAPAVFSAYPYPSLENDSPKDALSQAVGDAEYACGAQRLARMVERTNTPVYLYQFEYGVDAIARDRVPHGLDVNFLFGTNVGAPLLPPPSTYVLTSEDLELFRSIAGYWQRFAATGNPNTDDDAVVHWPAFNRPSGDGRGADKYLVLDRPISVGKRLREAPCVFWEPYFLRSITGAVPASAP